MIKWLDVNDETLKDVNEELFVIYKGRNKYIVDIAMPFNQVFKEKIWFVKQDGFVFTGVKYWAKIDLPKDIQEYNEKV
jgi:hypothetical protein